MVVLVELYPFIPLPVTLTTLRGHSRVKQLKLKIVVLGTFLMSLKLCMMITYMKLYTWFLLGFVSLTHFQGHRWGGFFYASHLSIFCSCILSDIWELMWPKSFWLWVLCVQCFLFIAYHDSFAYISMVTQWNKLEKEMTMGDVCLSTVLSQYWLLSAWQTSSSSSDRLKNKTFITHATKFTDDARLGKLPAARPWRSGEDGEKLWRWWGVCGYSSLQAWCVSQRETRWEDLHIGHSYSHVTHLLLLKGEEPPFCVCCDEPPFTGTYLAFFL